MNKLDQDFTRLGTRGRDYGVNVVGDRVRVTMYMDGKLVKKTKNYTLPRVYSQLILEAYERGLSHRTAWG